MAIALSQRAQAILAHTLAPNAQFRDGQWEAIEAVVQRRERLIVVQKTGWGKSLVYFMATRLHREDGRGMTLLVSPLLSLMRNQIEAARKFGLRVERIDSTNYNDHGEIQGRLLQGEVDLLIISPERLGNARFREQVWTYLQSHIGLMVIDEVHCISDWGHDFRPDYRRVMQILDQLPADTPLLGTTATANTRVINDVQAILGGDVTVSRGALTRESLQLYVYPEIQTAAYRLTLLTHLLKKIDGTGIIYCSTKRDCLIVSQWLQHQGFAVEPYFSNVEEETGQDRVELEDKLLSNKVKALVASVALGMGFDKADLAFVIHFQMPGSIIGYYQQIGRAGRGIDNAHIVLMRGEEDREIQEYFIQSAFPPTDHVEAVVALVKATPGITSSDIQAAVNVSKGNLEKIIKHLEIEGTITQESRGYKVSSGILPDFERWNRVLQQRVDELDQMEVYATTERCLMQFLAEALEDPSHPTPCGRCKNCRKAQSDFIANPDHLRAAELFLRHGDPIWIDPRKQWARRDMVTPKAKLETTNERGLALSYYNDAGYGGLVRQGKYSYGKFADELVEASAALIDEHWRGLFAWVTHVPSVRHPQLVADFAARLAHRLGLPHCAAVECMQNYPEQKTMQNSQQQLQNIAAAFSINKTGMKAPVLLVDDIIDSGWTLTLIGWQLRALGVPSVYPFVLARATGG